VSECIREALIMGGGCSDPLGAAVPWKGGEFSYTLCSFRLPNYCSRYDSYEYNNIIIIIIIIFIQLQMGCHPVAVL